MTDTATQAVTEQVKELSLKKKGEKVGVVGAAAAAAAAVEKVGDAGAAAASAAADNEAAEETKVELDLTKYGVHSGITCDGCKKKSFLGYRWKCIKCKNHDLCNECHGVFVSKRGAALSISPFLIRPNPTNFSRPFSADSFLKGKLKHHKDHMKLNPIKMDLKYVSFFLSLLFLFFSFLFFSFLFYLSSLASLALSFPNISLSCSLVACLLRS